MEAHEKLSIVDNKLTGQLINVNKCNLSNGRSAWKVILLTFIQNIKKKHSNT